MYAYTQLDHTFAMAAFLAWQIVRGEHCPDAGGIQESSFCVYVMYLLSMLHCMSKEKK